MPAAYFGINYQRLSVDPPDVRDRQLASISAAGIRQVRFTINWVTLEPTAPSGPDGSRHSFDFAATDPLVAALARHGLSGQPTLTRTPYWNIAKYGLVKDFLNQLGCASVSSRAPANLSDYGIADAALAKRYGPGGSFWAQNPSLPYRPVRTWEVWNEPNLVGNWCPMPEPERYAEMFAAAADAVRAVDPGAKLVVGGMPLSTPSGRYISPQSFLSRALAAQPSMAGLASEIGFHLYPNGALGDQLDGLGEFRAELEAAGIPDTTPIDLDELGWSTLGPNAIRENDRAARYRTVPIEVASSNCNVSAVLPFAWTSKQVNVTSDDDFYGIVDPVTAKPYPSATAYEATIATMRGQGSQEAPHDLVDACAGMPAPDADGDGVPDYRDYYPLDPMRSQGPAGWSN